MENTTGYKIIATTSVVAIIILTFNVYSVALVEYGRRSVHTEVKTEAKKSVRERLDKLTLDNRSVLYNLIQCESGWNEFATGYNVSSKSYDRGLLQINSKWHSEVLDECAYNATCSASWADQMITSGHGSEWTCWGKI